MTSHGQPWPPDFHFLDKGRGEGSERERPSQQPPDQLRDVRVDPQKLLFGGWGWGLSLLLPHPHSPSSLSAVPGCVTGDQVVLPAGGEAIFCLVTDWRCRPCLLLQDSRAYETLHGFAG